MNKDFQQLRQLFDGADSFMNGGHTYGKVASRKRAVPLWARSDEAVRKLVLRSFPKLLTNPTQRRRAGRWLRIIYLFFRLQWTHGWIAAELRMTPRNVRDTIRSIKRAAAGLRANGGRDAAGKRIELGSRRRGRPRTYEFFVFETEPLERKDL